MEVEFHLFWTSSLVTRLRMNRQLHPPTAFDQVVECNGGWVPDVWTFQSRCIFLDPLRNPTAISGTLAHILVILLTALSRLQGLMCGYSHFGLHHSRTENCNDHISYIKLKCKQHFSKCRQNFRLDRNRYAHPRRDLRVQFILKCLLYLLYFTLLYFE